MKSVKLKNVPGGRTFSYPGSSDLYFKLTNNKFLRPPETSSSLTELAAKFGEGRILHCSPESDIVLHD